MRPDPPTAQPAPPASAVGASSPTAAVQPASVPEHARASVGASQAASLPASAPSSAALASTVGSPPTAPAPGAALLIPVEGIEAASLRDNYDEKRGTQRHEAIDILAPRGTPVRAVADGHVAKLFTSVPGGLTVYQFDTSQTRAYYYAHLDRYAQGLKEGAVLRQGDLVGYVGFTGNASPDAPHLHFAVFELGPEKQWWKGTPVNPYPLLAGTAAR